MSTSARVKHRQDLLLTLVVEATERDEAGKLTRYFVPPLDRSGCHSRLFCEHLDVDGSDYAVLKGLTSRGLVRPVRGSPLRYAYESTEDGVLYYENTLRPKVAAKGGA